MNIVDDLLFDISFQAREKMNRWNTFVERLTPKKNYLKNAQGARKTDTVQRAEVPGKLKNRITGAVGGAYFKRKDDVNTVSQNVDGRPQDGNFAWVD